MEHPHRLTDRAAIVRRPTTALLLTLMTFLCGSSLLAQNPAYLFASRIGSTDSDHSNDIAIDASGNLYVTGSFRGTVDFDPGSGTASLTQLTTGDTSWGTTHKDIFVASYDASGMYRWAFNVGGNPPAGMSGDNVGLSIAVDSSGNVVVSGLFLGTLDFNPGVGTATLASPGWATFVARYDSAGNYLWAFKLGAYSNMSDVAIDANGNVVVVGSFYGTFDFDPGSGTANLTTTIGKGRKASNPINMFVAKYSSSGAYQWAFRIGNQYTVRPHAVGRATRSPGSSALPRTAWNSTASISARSWGCARRRSCRWCWGDVKAETKSCGMSYGYGSNRSPWMNV